MVDLMKICEKLYFDHQASTPLDRRVFKCMTPYLAGVPSNPHSSEHAFGWEAASAIENARRTIAMLLSCDENEIIFTSGATEANNLVFKGWRTNNRKKILSTKIEHKCVLETLLYMERIRGYELIWLKTDEFGYVDISDLIDKADENTALISTIGVHNEVGTLQPLPAISDIAQKVGAHLHFDLAQAPTAMPMSGLAHLADSISLSAHKFYGPTGVGCLYIRRECQKGIEPLLHGGGQQDGLRSGTLPVSLCVGMAAAAEAFLDIDAAQEERDRIRTLNAELWRGLQSLSCRVRLNGPDVSTRHPGNLNVSFLGLDAQDLIGACQPRLAISSGSACTSGIPEPSYVLRALKLSSDRVESAIRLSIGRQTTRADVQEAVAVLDDTVKRLSLLSTFR